ncbi:MULTISPECIES: type II secretion system minor pseudopilin GspK [unclassified Oceanobacter]|uniref:type II secretion system minor pseudopilin GspK n=1 Tax=unclassified Oceanobacter TaxID=2620260 RepID=UPI00273708F4|nr:MULTISPECIES: type II secretion system minor pseudopilin GspK [unclassified Oceanobacter]MDP2608545.1 type II secretion system minor pseudopilin GspK [Oceanobacter sp. 1_MG-2023]MDP2611693.1 type II secretion system minor pseudopilin GspK [Oceanobacter sp. 2_MG-2023]
MRRQQSGLALLIVLLIFAVVSVLATVLIERQAKDIQRTTAQLARQQAQAFLHGIDSVVRSGLYMDWDNDPDIDHGLEEWAIDRTFPMDEGQVFIRMVDAQGKFNLNWLAPAASNQSVWQQRLYNLLNDLGLDVTIAERLADWMDAESQVENDYMSLEPPYRPAYQICKHTSDLMLLEGVDTDTYYALEPYVTCLPVTTQLNINTASELVMSALDANFSITDAQAVVSARGDSGLASVSDFLDLDEVKGFVSGSSNSNDSKWTESDFTVKSEYFEVFGRVDIGTSGDWFGTSEFLLKRDADSGNFRTLYRDYSRREARRLPELPNTTP